MDQDDALRRLYREGDVAPADGDHPSPEALAALARGAGDERERLRRLDHVMACADCRAELELLRAVAAAERREPAPWRLPRWLPVAAGVVMVVALGALWPLLRGDDPLRDGSPGADRLVSPADGARGRPVRFVWHRVDGVERYRFELMRDDGIVAATAETTDTTWVLPDSVRLDPGGDYRWRVTAMSSDQRSDQLGMRRLLNRTR